MKKGRWKVSIVGIAVVVVEDSHWMTDEIAAKELLVSTLLTTNARRMAQHSRAEEEDF